MAKETEQISVRINPPLKTFLERWGARRSPFMKSATVARHAVDTFRELVEQLGSDWLEIERRASAAGQTPGAFIGSQLKDLLEADKKPKK